MNKKVIIGIVVVVVIITITVGILMLNRNNNKSSEGVINQSSQNNENNEESRTNENTENTNSKSIIAYFSLPETTGTAKEDSTITVNGETLGNTQYVANLIKEHTGADIFRIEAVKNYNTSDHQALIDDAKEEKCWKYKKSIKGHNKYEKEDLKALKG